jgi:hypothetical protein
MDGGIIVRPYPLIALPSVETYGSCVRRVMAVGLFHGGMLLPTEVAVADEMEAS